MYKTFTNLGVSLAVLMGRAVRARRRHVQAWPIYKQVGPGFFIIFFHIFYTLPCFYGKIHIEIMKNLFRPGWAVLRTVYHLIQARPIYSLGRILRHKPGLKRARPGWASGRPAHEHPYMAVNGSGRTYGCPILALINICVLI